MTIDAREGRNRDLGLVLTILLNNGPPDSDALLMEGSGVGLITVFQSQINAEFNILCKNPGDRLCLDGLETNLLRVTCEFFLGRFFW